MNYDRDDYYRVMYCPECNSLMALSELGEPAFICGGCGNRLKLVSDEDQNDYKSWCVNE